MSESFIEAEIWSMAQSGEGNVVMLKPIGMNTVVPIFIGALEAQAIVIALDGMEVGRPLTSDLFLDLAKKAGLDLYRIDVWDVKEDVFFARLYLSGAGHGRESPLVLDARPSDALALAVRRKCPVFISRDVAETAGNPLDAVITGKLESPRELMLRELEKAIAREDYEKAAKIRDKLGGQC